MPISNSKTASLCASALTALALFSASPAQAFEATWETTASDELLETLQNASAIWTAKSENQTGPDVIVAAVQSDYRTLLGTLYRAGYYAPVIRIAVDGREGKDISLVDLPQNVSDIQINVDTGARFRFGTASVSPLPANTVLPEDFASGKIARSGSVGEAKDAAITAWRSVSHARAALSSQSVVADHNTQTLDVALGIDPGPKVTFGRLKFAGNTTVSSERLLEITGPIAGKNYDPATFNIISTRLRNTDAFTSVSLSEAENLNADGSLDVTATIVEDDTPRKYGFGAQISSLEGVSLEAYWLHRNISKNADRLRFDGEIAGLASSTGVDYSLSASYRRPATTRPVLTLIAEAQIAHLDEPDYQSDNISFTVGAEVEISDKSYFAGSVGYRYSDVSDDLGNRTFSHIIFPLEAARDTRNDKLNPISGTYHSADVIPFIGISDSETGVRIATDSRIYKALDSEARFVLAARLSTGSVIGTGIAETPPEFLFFSGGGGTVRGQPYNSLDIETDGAETGGASYLGLSGELRTTITETISLVGFYDLGAISASSTPGSDAEWHSGAGLGLRYNTGFGPIRLDVAGPVSGDTGDGVQIYVGIGQAF